jgi:hypothetical protein
MDSVIRNECSHSLGFPIRKSPDHSLLAASRGLSQLTTSFFAFLRLGIHTHALSSLTIKSTSHTTGNKHPASPLLHSGQAEPLAACRRYFLLNALYIPKLVFCMPVNIQLSKISIASAISRTARLYKLLNLISCLVGGPRWNRTTDLTLIRGAL